MLKVGLTGGIGSGKSYIGEVFRSLGVPLYRADEEARRIMNEMNEVREAVIELFGSQAYKNNTLNRGFIAGMIFSDESLLKRLNSIVHPAVQKDFQYWTQKYHQEPYVLEEAAILFESGSAELMDYVIFVSALPETRINRVMDRDGISREDVLRRMRNQMDDKIKENRSNFVINNEKGNMILPQIIALHKKLVELNKI